MPDPNQPNTPPESLQTVDAAPAPVLGATPDMNQPPAMGAPPTVPTAQMAPVAAPGPAAPPTQKHGIIGKMIDGFKGSGSGTSASQFWRSLIGGALVGMGAAEDAPVVAHGPYGDIRDKSMGGAASRAFRASTEYSQQQKDRQIQQARQQKEEQRKDQESKIQADDHVLREHADARAQTESIRSSAEHELRMKELQQNVDKGNFDAVSRAAEVANQQVAFSNALHDVGAKPLTGPDGKALEFSTHDEAEKAAHDNPKFFIGNYKTRTAYNRETGEYGVYRVPDTDIKNVKLKDPQTGEIHTIARMTSGEYLDYMTKVQNLKKGALEITKINAEITRMQTEVKASGLYGAALKELTGATDKDGNVDITKVTAGSRAVLMEHGAKGLEDALRARSAAIEKHTKAVDAGDATAIDEANQNIEEATQIVKHYSGVLTAITGNKKAAASGPVSGNTLDPASYDKTLTIAKSVSYGEAVKNLTADPRYAPSDKQKLMKDLISFHLTKVPPQNSLVLSATGNLQEIPSSAAADFVKNNPGSKIVGQGTKQSSQESSQEFGSR